MKRLDGMGWDSGLLGKEKFSHALFDLFVCASRRAPDSDGVYQYEGVVVNIIHSYIHSFVYPFNQSFVYPFIHSFIHSFMLQFPAPSKNAKRIASGKIFYKALKLG